MNLPAASVMARESWGLRPLSPPAAGISFNMDYAGDSPREKTEEIEKLEQWKGEMMIVLDDLNLQEIGKELDLPVGANIAAAILPWIQMAKEHLRNNQGPTGTWAINARYWAKIYGYKPNDDPS
jgi:hypothetical protein